MAASKGRRRGWTAALVAALAGMLLPQVPAASAGPGLAPGDSVTGVMVGAGDIAGPWPGDDLTALLLDEIEGQVFTTGDNAYLLGSYAEYMAYYEASWGRHKARTRPAPGNHDYEVAGGGDGSDYFKYFGEAAGGPNGYYSYDVGDWHVVVLNGECVKVGGCAPGDPQEQWLRADLEASNAFCTAAIFHYPRFNSGEKGEAQGIARGQTFWEVLYEYGAEIVLSGDNHVYERFAPQTPQGAADPTHGIRQFTVGTGGGPSGSFRQPKPNSEARIADVHGVLKLTLGKRSYAWEFVPVAGQTATDSGSGTCHGVQDGD